MFNKKVLFNFSGFSVLFESNQKNIGIYFIYKSRSLNKLSKDYEQQLKTLSEENDLDRIIEIQKKMLLVKNALKKMSGLINRVIP